MRHPIVKATVVGALVGIALLVALAIMDWLYLRSGAGGVDAGMAQGMFQYLLGMPTSVVADFLIPQMYEDLFGDKVLSFYLVTNWTIFGFLVGTGKHWWRSRRGRQSPASAA
jgi:hypothetical protein